MLKNLNKNVAVIGLIDPDEEIINRERVIVNELVMRNQVIVSGLAVGCDTVAHETCLENNGKTIAILPSRVNNIYPSCNRETAERIVENGGLLVSEYYKEPSSKIDSIKRFQERDRLQAMFSKAVILIASYIKGEGDSGSRHAMNAAKTYKINRYVMLNEANDNLNKKFGLNLELQKEGGVNVLKPKSINEIEALTLPEQLRLF